MLAGKRKKKSNGYQSAWNIEIKNVGQKGNKSEGENEGSQCYSDTSAII